MKTFEITEEQIKLTHDAVNHDYKGTIEKWFPEAFEPQLEIGKWYKINNEDGYLLNYQEGEENCSYGFLNGEYRTDWVFDDYHKIKCEPATKDEVMEALINEAKRRGIKKGAVLKTPKKLGNGKNSSGFILQNGNGFMDFTVWNDLRISGGHPDGCAACVFRDGVWADVIQEKEITMEEIADKFGIPVQGLRIKVS